MAGQDAVDSQIARSLATLEEVRAQYRADRERARSDDETREAERAQLAEEHRAREEERAAQLAQAEQGTEADPATSDEAKWAAVEEQDRARFRIDDEPAPDAPRQAARHRAPEPDDEDDFSSTNWVDAE